MRICINMDIRLVPTYSDAASRGVGSHRLNAPEQEFEVLECADGLTL